MLSDLVYTTRDFYISNEVRLRPTLLLSYLNAICLYIKGFYYLINALTFTIDKVEVYIREKS